MRWMLYLRSSSRDIGEEHIDFILGDKVKGRAMTGLDGTIKKTPSWQLIMHHEQKIREKAAKLINESHLSGGERYNLATALKAARACRDTRDEEFEDKFRLQQDAPRTENKARGSNDRSPSVSPPTKRTRRGSDKGKGKGRGRGSSRDAKDKNNKPPPKLDNKTLHREKEGANPFATHLTTKAGAKRKSATGCTSASFASAKVTGCSTAPQSDKQKRGPAALKMGVQSRRPKIWAPGNLMHLHETQELVHRAARRWLGKRRPASMTVLRKWCQRRRPRRAGI